MEFKTNNSWLLLLTLIFCMHVSRGQLQGIRNGILYPRDSESRESKSLEGIWNFRSEPKGAKDLGIREKWYEKPLRQTGDVEHMPVPCSYQDLSNERDRREHIGWVWYDREFWISPTWLNGEKRVFLRFGSVNYYAIVWVNGIKITEHEGGHLPFQAELDLKILNSTTSNRITVAVNNTLTADTIPQGFVSVKEGANYPPNHVVMTDNFDFFKYAGIHRHVLLYTTPKDYIEDITVTPTVEGTTGILSFLINTVNDTNAKVAVKLMDKEGQTVASASSYAGSLKVENARLWWPYTMVKDPSKDAAYLYTLQVTLINGNETQDVYRLKVGIRSVKWNTTSFLINDKPFYFTGFGRHEDFFLNGRGFNPVILVKDHNLIKWTGANSYRTTHYPYSEELMDLIDELGIVVIDECGAVSLTEFGPGLLKNHKREMERLIQRDKNHPSVVMWSVANEARSEDPRAEKYFEEVVSHTKSMSNGRPVMIVVHTDYLKDKAAQFVDIIGLNRYQAWYSDVGEIDVIPYAAKLDVTNWIKTYKKPLIYTEYGSDTVAGFHSSPSWIFTEEWQQEYMREHFKVFDELRRNESLFIGEMIWNFADFMTKQDITRVIGNRKGVFTRERQPKASAHLLRSRYHLLANEYFGYPVPNDLYQTSPLYSPSSASSSSSNMCPSINNVIQTD